MTLLCIKGDPSLVVVDQSLQTASRSSLQTADQHDEGTFGGDACQLDQTSSFNHGHLINDKVMHSSQGLLHMVQTLSFKVLVFALGG